MENLFLYFIKASGLIGLFYLAYMLLLRKETFFTSNRWFLLSGLTTAAILPLVIFTKIVWVEPTTTSFDWSNIPVTTVEASTEVVINWYAIAGYIYIIGAVLLLLKLLFDLYSLSKVFKGKTIQQQADYKFIDVQDNIAPFSYFNYIVYNSSLYNATELENILEHEKVHSTQNHSVDVLLTRLFCIAFWFNPLIWLYKKAIVQNLEFIADSEASKNILDKKAYQLTLLKITTQENCVAISNHFYQSLIKKRIVMLNKNQSHKRNSWKYITVFPALVAFVFLFQIEVIAQEKETHETEIKMVKIDKINSVIDKNTTDKEIKEQCEELKNLHNIDLTFSNVERNTKGEIINIESAFKSEFGNGTYFQSRSPIKPFKFFYENNSVGYLNLDFSSVSNDDNVYIDGKKSTKEELDKLDPNEIVGIDVAKISGKKSILVTTKHNTNKTGTTIKVTGKEIYIDGVKSTNKEYSKLDKNTVDKVDVNTFENTIRITTRKVNKTESVVSNQENIIQKSNKTTNNTVAQVDDKTNIESVLKQDLNSKPLIVIDGVKQVSNFRVEDIPIDNVKAINVLKGISAIGKYGESAKNGVIEITMKDKNNNIENESQPFKVLGYTKKEQDKEVNGWKISGFSSHDGSKPLIVVDGKTKDSNFNIEDIPKEHIKKIDVLKGKNAEDKYGADGKNGVIEIKTK